MASGIFGPYCRPEDKIKHRPCGNTTAICALRKVKQPNSSVEYYSCPCGPAEDVLVVNPGDGSLQFFEESDAQFIQEKENPPLERCPNCGALILTHGGMHAKCLNCHT